ncbi:MAG: ABC transporter ATP-binding protein [Candidatus Bathyarchaeia archaeon]
MSFLKVEGLMVKIGEKAILEDVSFNLKRGENYVLFGPNGSGKTTLLNALMGVPLYEIAKGKIIFNGVDITGLSADERARLGISMGFQNPPEIRGLKFSSLLKLCSGKSEFNEEDWKLIEAFRLTEMLDRDVNVGFSGGERKRAEILQMLFLKPKLLLLDEPDSGVDVESLKLIASELQQYTESTGSSALIVTHKGDILEHIKAEHACVLLDGRTHCFPNPKEIFEQIKSLGYEQCITCQRRKAVGWRNG